MICCGMGIGSAEVQEQEVVDDSDDEIMCQRCDLFLINANFRQFILI